MANKQPFYHEVQMLFTTTSGKYLTKTQIAKAKAIIESIGGVVKGSVEVIESEPEPGDPADLM